MLKPGPLWRPIAKWWSFHVFLTQNLFPEGRRAACKRIPEWRLLSVDRSRYCDDGEVLQRANPPWEWSPSTDQNTKLTWDQRRRARFSPYSFCPRLCVQQCCALSVRTYSWCFQRVYTHRVAAQWLFISQNRKLMARIQLGFSEQGLCGCWSDPLRKISNSRAVSEQSRGVNRMIWSLAIPTVALKVISWASRGSVGPRLHCDLYSLCLVCIGVSVTYLIARSRSWLGTSPSSVTSCWRIAPRRSDFPTGPQANWWCLTIRCQRSRYHCAQARRKPWG